MKVELNIPESLKDITLGQYQKFQKIEEPTNEDLLITFLNVDINVIRNIKQSEFDRLVAHINSLFEAKQKHQLKFNLKGVSMGFIPNLDDISYGENKDLTTYVSDWKTMHRAMSVLYRPIELSRRGKYTIQEYEGTRESEQYKQMPLSVVMGAMVFFYNLTNALLKAIPNYLSKEMMKEQMSGQISEENGEAIKNSIHSLKETLGDLMTLQSYHSINA